MSTKFQNHSLNVVQGLRLWIYLGGALTQQLRKCPSVQGRDWLDGRVIATSTFMLTWWDVDVHATVMAVPSDERFFNKASRFCGLGHPVWDECEKHSQNWLSQLKTWHILLPAGGAISIPARWNINMSRPRPHSHMGLLTPIKAVIIILCDFVFIWISRLSLQEFEKRKML